jgi:hypothetical protein
MPKFHRHTIQFFNKDISMTLLKTLAAACVAASFSTAALADGPNIGACNVVQVVLGGTGGNAFTAVAPKQIQLRTGSLVDQIKLNGVPHGQNGGNASAVLNLATEEYINRMVVRHGTLVDQIQIGTNRGRALSGGGNGGGATNLTNIRVLAIGGRSGKFLDQIQITYCKDYLH